MVNDYNIKKLFGRKIKEYRKKLGYTQAKLAELVNVDDKHISCIESGKSFPSADLLKRFSLVLDIEPKNLFEFFHLQDNKELKTDVLQLIEKLNYEELVLVYKYIRNFII